MSRLYDKHKWAHTPDDNNEHIEKSDNLVSYVRARDNFVIIFVCDARHFHITMPHKNRSLENWRLHFISHGMIYHRN